MWISGSQSKLKKNKRAIIIISLVHSKVNYSMIIKENVLISYLWPLQLTSVIGTNHQDSWRDPSQPCSGPNHWPCYIHWDQPFRLSGCSISILPLFLANGITWVKCVRYKMPTFPDLFASRNGHVAWFRSEGELSLLTMNSYLERFKSMRGRQCLLYYCLPRKSLLVFCFSHLPFVFSSFSPP